MYGQLRVGPPLLFVLRGLNLSRGAPDVDAVCSTSGCDDGSFLNQVQPCMHMCHELLCLTDDATRAQTVLRAVGRRAAAVLLLTAV